MSSTPLNGDILLSILSVCPPKSATSIMATCRFLYHEGAKVLLQQPVALDGSEQYDLALLRFIQAEDLSRCSYVRALRILTDPIAEAVAKILVHIVPRMSNLERLCLRGEQSLKVYPYLLPAFASLRSVKILVVCEVGAQSCELVRTLQSELVIASILFNPTAQFGTDQGQSFATSRHPLHLLRRSASTLRELMCGFWCDAFTETPETLIPLPEVIYPEVRSLILCNNAAPNPIPYIQALPNLTRLRAESNPIIVGAQLGVCRIQRQLNLMLQDLTDDGQALTDSGEPLVWKHIQSYNGPLSDLWALGITFPIPRLSLTDVPGARSPLALTEVLAYARPIHLMLTFEDQPFTAVLRSDFLSALSTEDASGLRSLGLVIDLMAGDVDSNLDVGQTLTGIETVVSGLQLCDLQLVVRDITPPDTASAPFPSPDGGERLAHAHEHAADAIQTASGAAQGVPLPAHTTTQAAETDNRAESFTLAERTLEDFDVHAFVDRLSTSIPTIQNIVVSIGRPRRCGGGLRTGCLGKNNDKAEPTHVYTRGKIFYKELRAAELERAAEQHVTPSWASLSRAWHQGLRGWRDSEVPAVGGANII
ncbi:hypothetical protein LXA43DRAFT_948827 [Ganoderma leucocontextum]|nr:hypothetical protein LXA43DRAFT_948827 [Ganoderma leucocontextum]